MYRGLSIGAAKPDYPHHLIHISEPVDPYTAADFAADAKVCIDAILAGVAAPSGGRRSMPIVFALIQGLDDIPAVEPTIRTAIERSGRRVRLAGAPSELVEIDPEIARQLHPNHSQRICRALEVYRGTGVRLSEWQKTGGDSIADQFECVALCPEPRALLHQRIAARLDEMFEDGLVDEVRALRERGDLPCRFARDPCRRLSTDLVAAGGRD